MLCNHKGGHVWESWHWYRCMWVNNSGWFNVKLENICWRAEGNVPTELDVFPRSNFLYVSWKVLVLKKPELPSKELLDPGVSSGMLLKTKNTFLREFFLHTRALHSHVFLCDIRKLFTLLAVARSQLSTDINNSLVVMRCMRWWMYLWAF